MSHGAKGENPHVLPTPPRCKTQETGFKTSANIAHNTSRASTVDGSIAASNMATGTRRPSLSRMPSVSFTSQTSVTSHHSDEYFEEPFDPAAEQPVLVNEAKDGIWNTTRRKLTLASLCLVYFASTASFAILSPFFPSEAQEKGASSFMTGLIFGIYPIVVFIVAPIIGVLLPRIGPRFTLMAGLFLCAGSQILFGFVSMLPKGSVFVIFCILLRVVMALGGAAADTASFAIVAGEFGSNLGTVMGAMETFTGFGFMLGPPLGGVLFAAGGFRLPFIVMGGILLAALPLILVILPKEENVTRTKGTGSLLQAIKIPGVTMIGFCIFASGIVLSFLDPTFAPYLKTFGVGPSKVGLLFLLVAGCYAISAPIVGWITDKTGKTRVIIITGSFLVAFGYLLLAPAPFITFLPQRQVWLVCVSFVILGLGVSAYQVPCMPDMLESARDHGMPDDISTHGVLSGIFNAMASIGAFIGPTASGLLEHYLSFGWSTVFTRLAPSFLACVAGGLVTLAAVPLAVVDSEFLLHATTKPPATQAVLAGIVGTQGVILALFTICDQGTKRIRQHSTRSELFEKDTGVQV